MKICVAAICDFAQVRENLLSVMSAGITRIWRPSYPAHMGVMLALLIEIASDEARIPREIRVRIEKDDGSPIVQSSAGFQVDGLPPLNDPGELLMVPFVLDLREVDLPDVGRYQIVVDLMTQGVDPVLLFFRAGFPSEAGRR